MKIKNRIIKWNINMNTCEWIIILRMGINTDVRIINNIINYNVRKEIRGIDSSKSMQYMFG